jgi:hypothetical protein
VAYPGGKLSLQVAIAKPSEVSSRYDSKTIPAAKSREQSKNEHRQLRRKCQGVAKQFRSSGMG